MTHRVHAAGICPRIPWDYFTTPADRPFGVPGHFEFYGVMLHELGHLLGLDHLPDGDVMRARMGPGDRLRIGPAERAGLEKLYRPVGGERDGIELVADR
jgi:hypothetical protein